MKHEDDGDTNNCCCIGNSLQRPVKEIVEN